MPIPSPQPIASFIDTDNTVRVTMKANGSVVGMALIAQIVAVADRSLLTTKTVTVEENGSPTTKAKVSFPLSPDLDGLVVGTKYEYYLRVTNVGGRDVLAWGSISLKLRITA